MKLLTLESLDGHININVCKYGTCVSLTLDNGRFPTVRWFWGKKNVTKISICVIQACWSSLTLNSADMASDATVIFCLFYETTWDRYPLVLFPPRDEVVELRVVKVIRERLNQILMNSFCYKLFPPTHISQTRYGSVCIDSCFLCIRGSDNFLKRCWQNHLDTVMHTVSCRCFLSLYWC